MNDGPYRTPSIPELPKTPSTRWCEVCVYGYAWEPHETTHERQGWDCRMDDLPDHCRGPYPKKQ